MAADDTEDESSRPIIEADFGNMEREQGEPMARDEAEEMLWRMVQGDLSDEATRSQLVAQCPEKAPLTLERAHRDESEVIDREGSVWAMKVAFGEPRTPDRDYEMIGEIGTVDGESEPPTVTIVYRTPDGETETVTGEASHGSTVAIDYRIGITEGNDTYDVSQNGEVTARYESEDYKEDHYLGSAILVEVEDSE